MDCHSQVVVRGEGGKYLLVETKSRKLQIAYCRVKEDDDFMTAVQRCLSQVYYTPSYRVFTSQFVSLLILLIAHNPILIANVINQGGSNYPEL